MRFDWFVPSLALVALLAVAPPVVAAPVPVPAGAADLLLRVKFAGTAIATADTNLAYFTNFTALPETAALRARLIERAASLPARLLASPSTINHQLSTNLTPVFTDLLRDGFAFELRGDSNRVASLAIAARATPEAARRWSAELAAAAQSWSGTARSNTAAGWTAADRAVTFTTTNGVVVFTVARHPQSSVPAHLSALLSPLSSNLFEVELASTLLPDPIRRSTYGGFKTLKFAAVPSEQSLRIRGVATYAQALPARPAACVVPTNLISDPLISFTTVRMPGAWLAPDSAVRAYLPNPVPESLFFWSYSLTPYHFSVLIPHGTNNFADGFAPVLAANLETVRSNVGLGRLLLDADLNELRWEGFPMMAPTIAQKTSGGINYLVGGLFAQSDRIGGPMPEPLLERVIGRTNLVIYDWELTSPRLTGWIYMSQLSLMLSKHRQLPPASPSLQWILALTKLPPVIAGNTITEIAQSGPRELTLARRAPLAFTSTEMIWLGNWLESSNFPAANFLMPAPAPKPIQRPVSHATNAPPGR